MSNDIRGVSDTLAQISDVAAKARKPEHLESTRSAEVRSGAVQTADDAVSLTDTASKLQKLEGSLASVPVVDDKRVAEVRKAVNEGTYQIDHKSVADKFAKFEGLMDEVGSSNKG